MKCECGNDQFRHMIFVLQCTQCGVIQALPKEDKSGVNFLVERYKGDNPDNKPGQDGSVMTRMVDGNSNPLN
jgi:hypothetical protein